MPRMSVEDMKKPLSAQHKETLVAWYQSVLDAERQEIAAAQYENTPHWDAKKEKESRLETHEMQSASYVERFRKALHEMPSAYYYIFQEMTKPSIDADAVKDMLDTKRDYALLESAFAEKNHTLIQKVMDDMVVGNLQLRDPKALSDRYSKENGRDFELNVDDREQFKQGLEDLGIELVDSITIAETKEIKDNPRYSDKDRDFLLKKEIARLVQAEKNRVNALKSDKENAKGCFNVYLSQAQRASTLSRADAKKMNQQYSKYEKENKKLDTANDFYYKSKLECDKLRAKQEIFGKLTPKEEKKLLGYERKTMSAESKRAVVKDQLLKSFRDTLTAEAIDFPHNRMRMEQIRRGETRYFPLQDERETETIYANILERNATVSSEGQQVISGSKSPKKEVDFAAYGYDPHSLTEHHSLAAETETSKVHAVNNAQVRKEESTAKEEKNLQIDDPVLG